MRAPPKDSRRLEKTEYLQAGAYTCEAVPREEPWVGWKWVKAAAGREGGGKASPIAFADGAKNKANYLE